MLSFHISVGYSYKTEVGVEGGKNIKFINGNQVIRIQGYIPTSITKCQIGKSSKFVGYLCLNPTQKPDTLVRVYQSVYTSPEYRISIAGSAEYEVETREYRRWLATGAIEELYETTDVSAVFNYLNLLSPEQLSQVREMFPPPSPAKSTKIAAATPSNAGGSNNQSSQSQSERNSSASKSGSGKPDSKQIALKCLQTTNKKDGGVDLHNKCSKPISVRYYCTGTETPKKDYPFKGTYSFPYGGLITLKSGSTDTVNAFAYYARSCEEKGGVHRYSACFDPFSAHPTDVKGTKFSCFM